MGHNSATHILDAAGIGRNIKVQNWTDSQAVAIREQVSNGYKVEGDLRSEKQLNIKHLMDIDCCWDIRYCTGLPLRGRSIKNNARTRKGRRKTVTGKKKTTK